MGNATSVPLAERVIFSHTVEGLFIKALKPRWTPRLLERLRVEGGLDLQKRLDPALPFASWQRCLLIAAEELHPELSREKGLDELGACLTRGYFDTVLGAALAGILRLIGPNRALKRFDRSLRSGNNYAESRLTELAPNHFVIWTNEAGSSRHNLAGVVRQGVEIAGARNVRVAITAFDDASTTFDITWDQ